jgi:hypothetical protein
MNNQPQVNQEVRMKNKSDAVKKVKDNGSGHAYGAGKSDPSAGNSDLPREQMIAEAAYFHAERRGFTPENDVGDWLQAEADIDGLLRSSQ